MTTPTHIDGEITFSARIGGSTRIEGSARIGGSARIAGPTKLEDCFVSPFMQGRNDLPNANQHLTTANPRHGYVIYHLDEPTHLPCPTVSAKEIGRSDIIIYSMYSKKQALSVLYGEAQEAALVSCMLQQKAVANYGQCLFTGLDYWTGLLFSPKLP